MSNSLYSRIKNGLCTKKNLILKSSLQESESTMCFEIESMRIEVDSTRKLNLVRNKIKFNSMFELN